MFALWPGDRLDFSVFIKPTFGFAGKPAASEAGHIANTNVIANFRKTHRNNEQDNNHIDIRTANRFDFHCDFLHLYGFRTS